MFLSSQNTVWFFYINGGMLNQIYIHSYLWYYQSAFDTILCQWRVSLVANVQNILSVSHVPISQNTAESGKRFWCRWDNNQVSPVGLTSNKTLHVVTNAWQYDLKIIVESQEIHKAEVKHIFFFFLRRQSVDSLNGGLMTSLFCPVGRSGI